MADIESKNAAFDFAARQTDKGQEGDGFYIWRKCCEN